MKIAQFQMPVTDDKEANIQTVRDWCRKIKDEQIDLICLPEMFNCPYETSKFPEYAESGKGETWQALSSLAKENAVYIAGGSIPELEDGRYYNTAYVFDREGRQIGKHRKMHLFDIDIKDGQRFMESDILSAGDKVTVVDTEFGKIGIAICYDIRFPELTRLMTLAGAKVVFIPAAFNMTTGPAHWELLFRCRALDNQVYLFGTASAQNPDAGYQSYGHSLAVSPWGKIIKQLDSHEGILINIVDKTHLHEIREQLPLLKHRRTDIYDVNKIH
ncbi:MAG: carbon-nitrogen hydrolase family protein [Thermodesulfobacteriota bacterium]